MTEPLRLNLPHPDLWLAPVLEDHIYDTDSRPYDDAGLAAIVQAAVPVIAAAVLEREAETVESYGDTPPPESGGQWLRMRAEWYRRQSVVTGEESEPAVPPALKVDVSATGMSPADVGAYLAHMREQFAGVNRPLPARMEPVRTRRAPFWSRWFR